MNRFGLFLGLAIIGSIAFVGYKAVKEGVFYNKTVKEVIDGVKEDETVYVYENKISKYKISVPSYWGISEAGEDEAFESRAEMTSNDLNLKVISIGVDVVKPGKQTMALSTDEEFEKWDKTDSDTDVAGTTKLGEFEVAGQKVLILSDLTKMGDSVIENKWSMLGWFRKDGRNFYVRMFGRQSMDDSDLNAFKYLLATMEVE